ncbi:hypothetical protein L208DRAFT_1381783 [Tricholoma matsutake]|nr:hypothetical protein L208DRAFT_1381783 [Tricholoma matsutake 945]
MALNEATGIGSIFRLLNEDGYVIVAMMPRLINDCDTTKKVDMWTSLKKYVEKYYSSKSGLELGKSFLSETFGAFARPAELYHQFNFLLKKINESIKLVDPVFFDMLTQLHKRVYAISDIIPVAISYGLPEPHLLIITDNKKPPILQIIVDEIDANFNK